eukprot:56583-Eustigmatos_ZCMA.PRE.2
MKSAVLQISLSVVVVRASINQSTSDRRELDIAAKARLNSSPCLSCGRNVKCAVERLKPEAAELPRLSLNRAASAREM